MQEEENEFYEMEAVKIREKMHYKGILLCKELKTDWIYKVLYSYGHNTLNLSCIQMHS